MNPTPPHRYLRIDELQEVRPVGLARSPIGMVTVPVVGVSSPFYTVV